MESVVPHTLYDILELPRYASHEQVKAAFKRLAVMYHPDKNPGNAEYEEKFKEISNAYTVLSDEDSKRNYDLSLSGLFAWFNSRDTEEEKKKQRRETAEKVKRWKAEKEKERIRAAYDKLMKGTPLVLRRALNWVLMLVGIRFIVTSWFYTEESFSPLNYVLAGFFIIVGSIREQSLNYTILLYRDTLQKLRFNLYNRVIRNFILSVVICIALAIGTAHGIALYHFKYYSLQTTGTVHVHVEISNGLKLVKTYTYRVGDKDYTKLVPEERGKKLYSGDKVLVRYSYQNPVFAKIIDPTPAGEE